MTTLKTLSFSIQQMERFISQKNYAQYEACLHDLFHYLDHQGPIETVREIAPDGTQRIYNVGLEPIHRDMPLNQKMDWYTRLATTITAYLSDTTYVPPEETLIRFVLFKSQLANFFYLSVYENMDHILYNRGLMNERCELQLKTEQDIKYLLACYTLNSDIPVDFKLLIDSIPFWGTYAYIALLYGHHHCFNQRILNNFNQLIEDPSIQEDMPLDFTAVELATGPWMLSSYWDVKERHGMKTALNKAIEKWVQSELPPGLKKKISRYVSETKEVKKVVVLSEKYISKHAMYRCFHPSVSALKEKYDVTLVSAPNEYDDQSAKDFHRVVEVRNSAQNIAEAVKAIAKLEPDLIIYPSIGMAKWTIPLCNMRLAKYQAMCYGHPASAFSDYINYGISSDFPKGPDYQKFMQETLLMAEHRTQMARHPDYEAFEVQKPNDGVVRIAINSSLPKISNRFINLCQLLQGHSSVPLEFHFYMGEKRNCTNTVFHKSLLERLGPNVVLHDPAPYNEYMQNLSQCDLALGTFPFGGANSNIDLALLGIPKIYYAEGSDLASYTDSVINQKLEISDHLKADSEAALIANAIYLIHNQAERELISQKLKDYDIEEAFFKPIEEKEHPMILDAISIIEQSQAD